MNINILQSSGETHLSCGGKCYHSFVANLLLIQTVKELKIG